MPDLSFAPIMGGAIIAAESFIRHGLYRWRRWRRRPRMRDGALVVYAEFAIIDRDE